jgi:hypothetical protein
MKLNFLFALLLFSTSLFQSCKKEDADPNANLTGVFKVSSVKVDGVASVGSGTITFDASDKSESLELKYRIDSADFTTTGDFIYTATNALLSLNPGTANELKWTRKVDKEKEQGIEFTQTISGKNRIIAITFTK